MHFVGWITTDKVGSRVTFDFEVPDDELQAVETEAEKNEIIDSYARDEMWNHAEWGWKPQKWDDR